MRRTEYWTSHSKKMIFGGSDDVIEASKTCDDVRATVVDWGIESAVSLIGRPI